MAADRLRIVTFSTGGRPVVSLDVNDTTVYSLLRDTFKITPPARNPIMAKSTRRFGGSRPAGETHDNGTIAAEWYVQGGSADATEAQTETLVTALCSTTNGRYLEWRPTGASRSTYFALRGPGDRDYMYRNLEMGQASPTMHVSLTFQVAPLAEGDRMDIADDFAVDSTVDYVFDTGSGTSITGGALTVSSTTEKRMIHTSRAYQYADAQATLKFTTPGALGATFIVGTILKRIDASNYLVAQIDQGNTLRIYKVVAGVATQLATVAFTPTTSTSYWVRFRQEGNVLIAEAFTAAPTPLGAPAATCTATLAGGDITTFGSAVSGYAGLRITPGTTSWTYDDFTVEPYTYRNQTLPAQITLNGAIPGSENAKADLLVTPSGGAAAPIWAWMSWAKHIATGLAAAPFGVIEAETAGNLSSWASTADATARGGTALVDSAASSAHAYSASWSIDPSLVPYDDFTEGYLGIEVWARVKMSSTLVTPQLTLSVRPEDGLTFGAERFTDEWGSGGKILVVPNAGTHWRYVRLGTLPLLSDTARPRIWKLWLAGALGAGSSGTFSVDYLVLGPVRQRVSSDSSRANDSNYPAFVASTSETTKIIHHDGSGGVAAPPKNFHPDTGLKGQLIELPPVANDVVVKLSSLVPDDPTLDATDEQLAHSATVRFSVTPRYHLARGS